VKVIAVAGLFGGRGIRGTTDAEGLARVVPWVDRRFRVNVSPPDDEPYLAQDSAEFDWPRGAERHRVELKLQRGVIVRGRVVEEPSGKPVAGARVAYFQTSRDNPLYQGETVVPPTVSKVDGTFNIVVPVGPGHLLVHGPTPDYLHLTTSHGELGMGTGPNRPLYPDALAGLDLKPEAATHDVTLRLRRAVTVAARVTGPDGEPVAQAIVLGRSYAPHDGDRVPSSPSHGGVESLLAEMNRAIRDINESSPFHGGAKSLAVRHGRVDIPGLDPEKSTTFYVLDRKNQLGATVELSGKSAAGGPVPIRLVPCGSAVVRYKDELGKPVAGHEPDSLVLVVTPGAEDQANAAIEFLANLDPQRNRGSETGADGRVTFVTLIPGARYQLRRMNSDDTLKNHAITAEAGKTVELPDVVVTRNPK
jgi:hypothetical protein